VILPTGPQPDAPGVKGALLLDLVKWARRERDAFAALLPVATRDFIETRVLIGSWYPEVHLENLLVAVDRLHGQGDLALCRKLGRLSALNQLQGVYRTFLAPGDPVGMLSRIPSIFSLQHNTGTLTMDVPAAGHVRFQLAGFGLPSLAQCVCIWGWLEGVVELAGARCEIGDELCRVRGDAVCVYGVHWTLPA
jgi:hypothetical protein